MTEKQKILTIDIETENLDPWHDKLLLVAYRYDNGPIEQIKVYNNEKPHDKFLTYLADPNIVKQGHNVRFDLLFLAANGFTVQGPISDTRLLAYLEDPLQELDLKGLVERKLKRAVVRMEDFGRPRIKKHGKKFLNQHPNHQHDWKGVVYSGGLWCSKGRLEQYNKSDVSNTDDLKRELVETPWYKEVEQPLSQILFQAEERGIQLDIPYLQGVQNEFEKTLEAVSKELGTDFNPSSPKQVKEKFKKQGINLETTDKHQLKQLAWNGNHLAECLLRYRGISKLLGTYVKPLIERSVSGRIHGRFNQAGRESQTYGDIRGTATGRLSSSDPNLQNIPDRTEEGRKIRKAFIATPKMILIDSDLKQIEPRLIAHYSQSKVLLDAYQKGLDTHAIMGGLIFNKRPSDLTKLERFIGKTSWLATVYGCWFKKLRFIAEINSDEKLPFDDAFYERVQSAFWTANPEIRAWRESLINESRARGAIETLGGRILKIPSLASKNKWERQEAERLCVNYEIQGSAADIAKLVVVNTNKMVKGAGLLAVVHDEQLLETDTPENICYHINNATTNAVKLKNVEVIADTRLISSWADK